jgi:hypothetical protein
VHLKFADNVIGAIGASTRHDTDTVVSGLCQESLQQAQQIPGFIVRHHTDFGFCHVLEIACFMAMIRKEGWNRIAVVAMIGHIVLALWFVERGRINADEGWYLYAARQIAGGLQPYQDFQFFQVPVFPRVLAGFVDPGPGSLISGRWLSWVTLLFATGVTALGARRVAGAAGAAVALVIVGLNPLIVSTAVLVKPYALSMLLLSSGLFLLLGREGRVLRTGVGFFLLALAACTRLSVLAVVIPLLLAQPGRHRIIALAGAGLGTLMVAESFHGVSFGLVWDQWVGFHLADGGTVYDRLAWLFHGVTVWGVLCLGLGRGSDPIPGLRVAAIFGILVHMVPAALHIEHIVVLAPVLVLSLSHRWGSRLIRPRVLGVGVGVWLVSVFAGARFVHLDAGHSTVQQAMELGAWLHENSPEGKPLLTQQVVLAVEADRDVVEGLEMGRFGTMSAESISEALRGGVGAVALADGDFDAHTRALITDWASVHLDQQRVEEPYGQFDDRIWMWGGSTLWMR